MESLYIIIPIAIIFFILAAIVFLWAVKNGQFDDLDAPSHHIIMDNEELVNDEKDTNAK